MKDATTGRLDGILSEVNSVKSAEDYIKEYAGDRYEGFSDFFQEYLEREGVRKSDVVRRCALNKNYVYQIIRGVRKPSRDKVLALCIGAGMNYTMTNRALKLSGWNPLYPKDERDVRIGICINMGNFNVTDVNLVLEEHGLDLIAV